MINKQYYQQLKIEKDLAVERDIELNLRKMYAPPDTWCRWTDGLHDKPYTPHTNPIYSWLEHVGGLGMSNIQTEAELAHAAYSAPTLLLFGLAHGRYIDCTTRHPDAPACNHPTEKGDRSKFTEQIIYDVAARGYFLQDEVEKDHPAYVNYLTPLMSCENREDLWNALVTAPNDFYLGQVTSWLLTNLSGGEEMRNGWTPDD